MLELFIHPPQPLMCGSRSSTSRALVVFFFGGVGVGVWEIGWEGGAKDPLCFYNFPLNFFKKKICNLYKVCPPPPLPSNSSNEEDT